MKGRSGPTGVATTHEPSVQLEHAEQGKGRQSSGGTQSTFQRQVRKGRLTIAIAGLAIAFLIADFFGGLCELPDRRGIPADLVESDEPVVTIKRGVFDRLGRERRTGLLQARDRGRGRVP